MSTFGWHEEVGMTAASMRERAFEVARVLEARDQYEPGEWQQRYEEAVQARQSAEEAHDSAVLWADFEGAVAYSPAPEDPEAGS